LAVVACSAGYEPNGSDEPESVAEVGERLVLASTVNCTVQLTKLDYDQVGSDTFDYIELKVTKKGPGNVNTLGDCGVGAIALYDDAGVIVPGVLCTSYSQVSLGNVVIPADGYVEIGQNQSTVGIAASGADGWIHNGRGEIAILNTALPDGIPTTWLTFEGVAKCNLLALPVVQIQTEGDGSPNVSNVSCDNTFHTLNATSAVQKTTADCPTGGSGGSGGMAGAGGLSNLGGTGGLNLAGGAGSGTVGGAGAGMVGSAGSGTVGGAGAGMVGGAGSGMVGDAGADAGGVACETAGGAAGSSSTAGEGGEVSAEGGMDGELGGSSSTAAQGGKADGGKVDVSKAGNAHAMVAEGGGCSCSIPSAPNQSRTRALAVVAALVGLCLRRRRQAAK
jgi:MYXO-CTERM domain-containing protein